MGLSLGVLGAVRPVGGIAALGGRAVLPLSKRVHSSLSMGVFFDSSSGKVSARDAQLGLPLYVVNKPSTQLVLTPGLSLPLGSASSGLEYTLLTTGSFDPTLGASFSAGSAWLVFAQASVRAPLHPGFDRVQQGLFTTASLQGAHRIAGGGVSIGVAGAVQQRRGYSSPGFTEMAAVGAWSHPLGDRWGLNVSARVPVWTDPSPPPYYAALRIGLNRILKLKKED